MKKAFTLIELLVVIAIIAILAAILFPVFAQAKLAAKQTVNLSNQKQLGLAVIMYTVDFDDYFPLAQREEPLDTAFSGVEPWSVSVQPYVKSWGLYLHPLGPSIPSSPASVVAFRQTQFYGAMAKAENNGFPFYQAIGPGSFERRVCASQPCKYEGLFGNWEDPLNPAPFGGPVPYGGLTQVPSYSATGVSNPADSLLITEGAMWDLWSGIGQGISNPCTYGVYWNPVTIDILGAASYSMACPGARKNARAQSAPTGSIGSCSPANLCDGVVNFGIQNGMTTYVATDGHATTKDYRGGVMAQATLPNGDVVIKSMWPAGGF